MSLSYFPYNEGTFTKKTSDPTLVTAFYDIPSTVSLKQRKESLQQFLQDLPSSIIVFTESKFANEIASFPEDASGIRVVVLERLQWVANVKFKPSLWTDQVKQNPELRFGRSAEEFQFAYEKKEFMTKAAEMNPFASTDFLWIDPTFYARKQSLSVFFPIGSRIPTDRILVSNPEPFTADDVASSYFKGKYRTENSILAGSKSAWDDYSKLYDLVITQKLRIFSFIGDDLLVLNYMIIHKPKQFCLVKQDLLTYLSTLE
jgi:hypothetical protein